MFVQTRDVGLSVGRHPLLEEVGLLLEGAHVHEVEGVGRVVDLVVAESNEKAVSDKLDVLVMSFGVHANETDWQGV
jgi:hypothetical protein